MAEDKPKRRGRKPKAMVPKEPEPLPIKREETIEKPAKMTGTTYYIPVIEGKGGRVITVGQPSKDKKEAEKKLKIYPNKGKIVTFNW